MTNTHVFDYHCPRRPCACVHFCEMLLTEHLRMPYGWLTEVSAGRNREKKTTALPPCSRHPPSTAEQHWWCACWLVQETLSSIWKHPPCLDLSESTNVRPRLKDLFLWRISFWEKGSPEYFQEHTQSRCWFSITISFSSLAYGTLRIAYGTLRNPCDFVFWIFI